MVEQYKCPRCGAIGDDILYKCCTSNRVYVTHNLKTDEWIYECDDVEDTQYCGCHVCGREIGYGLDDYIIEVDECASPQVNST